jgi:hypothetical protein
LEVIFRKIFKLNIEDNIHGYGTYYIGAINVKTGKLDHFNEYVYDGGEYCSEDKYRVQSDHITYDMNDSWGISVSRGFIPEILEMFKHEYNHKFYFGHFNIEDFRHLIVNVPLEST